MQHLESPIVCPWFMSDGWFVRTHLPKRFAAAGLTQWQAMPPMGLMPGIGRLMSDRVQGRLAELGWSAAQTTVILAVHESPASAKPRDVARAPGPASVLPFFAARAGHVTGDLPEELALAGFTGSVLDPVGIWRETPALALAAISASLSAAAA